ncbi:MAG: hypothetical protein E3J66_06140 [Dehalococcoidia bacterium]|nr:MAG: hypothetical protein E3J66_06140 [Dehalococcoidia bacterium]
MKKKLIAMGLAIVLLLSLGVGSAFAADQNPNASAKATAQIAELHVISQTTGDPADSGWVLILDQTIKTANKKDLFIDASLLSALYTKTNVKSKGGVKDTSSALAVVWLKVVVDEELPGEQEAFPGAIVYNARYQELSATLQGIIDSTAPIVIGDPEEIELIIATMSANSFNFIVPDLSSGMHTIEVWAKCSTDADSMEGDAKAIAVIGLGSVTVEEVRMVKGENVIVELPD